MPTHYKGHADEVRALDAYIKLARANDSLALRLQPNIDAAGLTYSQFGVLEALHHLGPLCMTELARKILKTGGNITMVVGNLEKRGLVTRERSGEDRRYFRIRLTPAGTRLIREVFPRHVAALVREFSLLSPVEQATLARLVRKLGRGRNGKSLPEKGLRV